MTEFTQTKGVLVSKTNFINNEMCLHKAKESLIECYKNLVFPLNSYDNKDDCHGLVDTFFYVLFSTLIDLHNLNNDVYIDISGSFINKHTVEEDE